MAFKRKKFSGFKSNGDDSIMLDEVRLTANRARNKVSTKLERFSFSSNDFFIFLFLIN